ncbi:MAG: hypothetical protein IPJ81_11295 [Chitinophagaceae bacterium]|nr:hypothetical protein [Chitinophagaceae bacterium]
MKAIFYLSIFLFVGCFKAEEKIVHTITNDTDSSSFTLNHKMRLPHHLIITTTGFWDDTILYNGVNIPPQYEVKKTALKFYSTTPSQFLHEKYKAKNWHIKIEFVWIEN